MGAATTHFANVRAAHLALDADRLLLGCVALLYLPLVFMGPGSDPDSIRELHSGATLLQHHRYLMSRPPGYFPYELLCGALYAVGGTVATNCASIAMSLVLLDSFLRICERFKVPHRHLLAVTMAIHPVYWTASTSTIDFVWALGCFFVGFRTLLDRRYWIAAAMLGLAIGMRLSSVLLVAPLLTFEIIARPRDVNLLLSAVLTIAIGAAFYVPAFVASGNSFAFLTYYVGAWSWADYLGRFLYKNVYFWGLPAALFLCGIAPMMLRALIRCERKVWPVVALSLSIVIAFEALFLKVPVQRAYLLPILPFVLILLGIAARGRARILVAFALLLFSYDFVNLNLARADVPDHATRAILGPFVEPGYIISDARMRLNLATATCF
jgi:hypothetical protein